MQQEKVRQSIKRSRSLTRRSADVRSTKRLGIQEDVTKEEKELRRQRLVCSWTCGMVTFRSVCTASVCLHVGNSVGFQVVSSLFLTLIVLNCSHVKSQ